MRDLLSPVASPSPHSASPSRGAWMWAATLVGLAALASGALACATPFAAMAAIAARTLDRRSGLAAIMGVWLTNQAIGFGLLDYPWTAETVAWGVAIALASIAALLVAREVDRALAVSSQIARHAVAFACAFTAYELVLRLASIWLGSEGLSLSILLYIAEVNAAWMVGLAVAHMALMGALSGRGLGLSGPTPSHS